MPLEKQEAFRKDWEKQLKGFWERQSEEHKNKSVYWKKRDEFESLKGKYVIISKEKLVGTSDNYIDAIDIKDKRKYLNVVKY